MYGGGTTTDCTELEDETAELLRDIAWFSESRLQQAQLNPNSLPKDAFTTFCKIYRNFLDEGVVHEQYLQFAEHYKAIRDNVPKPQGQEKLSGLAELFYIMAVSGTGNVFHELYTMVWIAATLPVTSVTAEVSFSKLKLVLTRLRTTTGEERLEDLITVTSESDVEYSAEEVIDLFASQRTALRRLLL